MKKLCLSNINTVSKETSVQTINLKWVIAHQPVYLFQRVAEDFQRIVNNRSESVQINIEILTAEQYNAAYSPAEPADRHNLWKFLQSNQIQIAQMQTTSLARQANKQMYVYDLPYLFEDHDHAAEVLEGEIGQKLLNTFDAESRLKGLAYTYSGGFRLMPMAGTVTSLAEVVGQPIRAGLSMISQDTMRAFGLEPVPTDIEGVTEAVQTGRAVGAEHVAQRLLPDQCDSWINSIVDTEHSLFLTTIVVNQDWWNSLDASVQQIFSEAALEAARNERALSLADGAASLEKLASRGVTVTKLSQSEMADLRDQTEPVYKKYTDTFFEPGLVQSIRRH
jgi:TRAP-type C4-dicarboxylate transport system substrate-binding protein